MAKGFLSRHAIAVGAAVLMAGTTGLAGRAEAQFGGGQPQSGGARSGPSAGGAARGDGGGMRRGAAAGDVRGNRGGGGGRGGDGMFGGGRGDGARGPSAGSGRGSGPRGPIVAPRPGPVVGGGSKGPSHGGVKGPRHGGGWGGHIPPLPPRHRPRPPGVSYWYWSGIPIFATDYDGCGYEYYKWRSTGSSYWRRMYFECRDEEE